MRAALACALALASALQDGAWSEARARVVGAPADAPLEVAIGEPFEVELELYHAPDLAPSLAAFGEDDALGSLGPGPFELDAGWVWFEGTDFAAVALGDGPHAVRSEARLRVAALEPTWIESESGALAEPLRSLPLLEVALRGVDGEVRATWEVPELAVRVLGVLAADDVEPRPPSGLLSLPPSLGEDAALRRAAAIAVASIALLALGLGVLVRGGEHGPLPVAPPTPTERLARAKARRAAGLSGRAAVDLAYELGAIVRESTTESLGARGPSATDDEWLASIPGERLPDARRAELERFFQRLGRIKYAGEAPSTWALDELLTSAEGFVAPSFPGAAGQRAEVAR